MSSVRNVGDLMKHIRVNFKNPRALNYFDNGGWRHLSTEEFIAKVKHLTLGLVKLGVKRGDRVGILLVPSAEWTIANLAIILAGGISVPLFANISDENFSFQVAQTEMRQIFVSGPEQFDKLVKHRHLIETVISVNQKASEKDMISYDDLIAMGYELDQKSPELYPLLEDSLEEHQIANILYTSGSTGVPKGVEITHRNVTAMIDQNAFELKPNEDRFLSILPLAHIFGYALNVLMLGTGVPIYYFNDLKAVGSAAQEVHPTIMIVVPRLLEKIYARLIAKLQEAPPLKRTIGRWAFDLAAEPHNSILKHMMHPVVDKLVYSNIREALGGELRIVISGGSALDPKLCRFFIEVGIPLYEGWGMTEGTPITVNRPGHRKIGSVGLPLEGNQVKIGENGEVLAKGVVITPGYYKNPAITGATIDGDGWLHTGDKGFIDDEGYLTLVGRLKELYKSSTGEYIAPIPIEQALCQAPLIDAAMVVADNRKFASVLLFPNYEVLHKLKEDRNENELTDEEFLNTFYIKAAMDKLINEVNSHLNHWEEIHAYAFVTKPLSIEEGDMTPSMKLRREAITQKNQQLIESMYQEANV